MNSAKKVFSFAKMMVLAQRRHDARIAATQAESLPVMTVTTQRAETARKTLQKMNGTKRLVVFTYAT